MTVYALATPVDLGCAKGELVMEVYANYDLNITIQIGGNSLSAVPFMSGPPYSV